jgi:DNA-3-methyladenine glycosylase II
MPPIRSLTEATLLDAVRELCSRDPDLAAIVRRYGPPPLWARPNTFATLVHTVLEQQVSLASAQAAFDRLVGATGRLTPAAFLALDDARLLRIGFSRQKARYVRLLAGEVDSGRLDIAGLESMDDEQVSERLLALTGIGPWTVSVYLLLVLLRPDVWPATDLALATALTDAKGMDRRPNSVELEAMGEQWRPWRSVAARLFWHDYLSRRRQKDSGPFE